MAKTQRSTKAQIDKARGQAALEQTTTHDDSLLPPAEELSRLKDIDPTIIEWIKTRTEKEQDARIRFNDSRMEEFKKMNKRDYILNSQSLYMAFIIMILGMLFSGYLIREGHTVAGTIFAAGTLSVIVIAFIKRGKENNKKED